ncbi:hypothetical protein KIN20_019427 [Parelaphostrongylus tenuis]|uniref:Uncharacterized protein n=1 Tax=Parelaphostrongylus tenuis TaxID=148309 RepID=A0AAD5MLC1_PARTN|nr:hypothetical protein KIN20_019427 [Parelaphostrongylus tenuis]
MLVISHFSSKVVHVKAGDGGAIMEIIEKEATTFLRHRLQSQIEPSRVSTAVRDIGVKSSFLHEYHDNKSSYRYVPLD